jgi:hypothetical protein
LSTVCLSMYSITEKIYYQQLSSVAILLQPEPNCFRSYNTRKALCSLSVLSSCRLPLPPTCLLLTANEALSCFASTILRYTDRHERRWVARRRQRTYSRLLKLTGCRGHDSRCTETFKTRPPSRVSVTLTTNNHLKHFNFEQELSEDGEPA